MTGETIEIAVRNALCRAIYCTSRCRTNFEEDRECGRLARIALLVVEKSRHKEQPEAA